MSYPETPEPFDGIPIEPIEPEAFMAPVYDIGTGKPVEFVEPTVHNESVEPAEADRPGFFKRYRGRLALGAFAVSMGATLAFNPLDETLQDIKQEAPAVAAEMLAMEALWLGGAAMMVSAVGGEVKNPLKLKQQIPALAQRANDSKLFKAGFVVNTVGAVGEFVAPAIAVTSHLPVESWGVLMPSLVDLGITIAVRRAITQGVRDNVADTSGES